MSGKNSVPDAWDDDWVNVADTKADPLPAVKLSKAEKRAQHQQLQKEIWASAESPARNLWLEAKGAIPLKQEYTPAMTVLSRKPAQQIARRDVANGVAGLSLQDEDDSEEEARKKRESELEERQRKAKLEREEKVRKYAEARERIMGSSAPSSPKVKPESRDSSQGRSDNRRRGGAGRSNMHNQSSRQSPARSTPSPNTSLLFDPEDMARRVPRKEATSSPDYPATPKEGEPVRQPRGPDGTGKAGFAASPRGGRAAP